jgi:hypothetical protein
MGFFQHPRVFTPHDLEIIDRVHEATWAQVEARQFFRNHEKHDEHQDALRKFIMDLTGTGRIDFDTLYARVLTSMPEPWTTFGPIAESNVDEVRLPGAIAELQAEINEGVKGSYHKELPAGKRNT